MLSNFNKSLEAYEVFEILETWLRIYDIVLLILYNFDSGIRQKAIYLLAD